MGSYNRDLLSIADNQTKGKFVRMIGDYQKRLEGSAAPAGAAESIQAQTANKLRPSRMAILSSSWYRTLRLIRDDKPQGLVLLMVQSRILT
jgi:hypothetical protein